MESTAMDASARPSGPVATVGRAPLRLEVPSNGALDVEHGVIGDEGSGRSEDLRRVAVVLAKDVRPPGNVDASLTQREATGIDRLTAVAEQEHAVRTVAGQRVEKLQ